MQRRVAPVENKVFRCGRIGGPWAAAYSRIVCRFLGLRGRIGRRFRNRRHFQSKQSTAHAPRSAVRADARALTMTRLRDCFGFSHLICSSFISVKYQFIAQKCERASVVLTSATYRNGPKLAKCDENPIRIWK